MFKVTQSTLVLLSGCMWFAVGCVLLPMGLNFIIETLLKENQEKYFPVLNFLSVYVGGREPAALVLIAFALLVGFIKGRKVFSKSVNRSVKRILALQPPCPITKLYTPSYLILLGCMMFLGMLVRFLPLDIRGLVDIAVGSALINGAVLFFREGFKIRSKQTGLA